MSICCLGPFAQLVICLLLRSAWGGGLSLREARFSAAYRGLLQKEFGSLKAWCASRGLPGPSELPDDTKELNLLLGAYIEDLHRRNADPSRAKHACLCVQWKFPHTVRQLKEAWVIVRTWQLQLPVS